MRHLILSIIGLAMILCGTGSSFASINQKVDNQYFQRVWTYVSETSFVISWQLGDISQSGNSYVEYGKTEALGSRTPMTIKPRRAHIHWIKNLVPGSVYYFRMVTINPESNNQTTSEIYSVKPEKSNGIRIPEDFLTPPPYILNKTGATYILTKDITTDGTAIEIAASDVTLDLDGHMVIFGNNTSEQVYGVRFADPGNAKLCNGHIVQGKRSRDYSAAIASLDRSAPTEISGISTDVHLPNAFPVIMTHANGVDIHHNHIFSRVTELESRHYPGNSLILISHYGGNIRIHDNLISEGCHWGINIKHLGGGTNDVEIDHNDIRHHMQYVNGYALAPSSGALVHHNRITSTGRATHLTGVGTQFFDNYIDIRGHQDLCDLPERTRPFYHRLVELHGIKFEGSSAKSCKIYNNYVRIIQSLPEDSNGLGRPEDKIENGVYTRSIATSIEKYKLRDSTQNWETDRWRYYFVKYDPDLPPSMITGNDATTLFGEFGSLELSEYTIYMKWNFVPPTPLNLACYDPNGMNEIYNNTFIAITEYRKTRHGTSYGEAGEWATAVMLIDMTKGPADPGKYSAFIYNNRFFSNDLFFNSGYDVNMTIRMENNTFTLMKDPFPTERSKRIHDVGNSFENYIRNSNNTFIE